MRTFIIILLSVCLLMVLVGCRAPATQAPPAETEAPPVETEEPEASPAEEVTTIKVWDYYGTATPFQPEMIAAFEVENPGIKVEYEALNWDSMFEKLSVALTTDTAPDVATVDMTWVPTWAALGGFTELDTFSGGQLNGVPLSQAFTAGALEAMSYESQVVAILEDFDVYSLYYRSDLFEEKGLEVPTNWDELVEVGQQLAEDSDGDGTPDKYLYGYWPETFRWAQFLYESGGEILNPDNTEAIFNGAEGVEATQFFVDMANQHQFAFDIGEESFMQLLKDGTIAMFSDGPYMMGVLKDGAPEMEGMWKVARHPYKDQPGSYLGGTGLVIPAGAANKEAAWKFIEFALRLDNAIGVYENAGAAPGLKAALESDKVSKADPYFGDQVTLPLFLQATETAHHFPYVRQWNEISAVIDEAVASALLEAKTVQEALDDATVEVNALLAE
jgi:ABC-type glycerol-3-phosphate transport system substrate-binding protein